MRFLGNALSGWWEQQSEGSLRSLVTGPLKQEEEQVRVGEVIKEREWDIYSCFFDLSQNLQQRIRATPIPYAEHFLDTLSWRFSALG